MTNTQYNQKFFNGKVQKIMKTEMTRYKLAGLIVFAGILMWYFCPWFARLLSNS